MNIHVVPMLISGVLCTLLAIVTWLFRARDHINRVFSLYTLALAVDALVFFARFQFGKVEDIHSWMRITVTIGFVVPLTLIYFFFGFTGYNERLEEKVLGVKARTIKKASISLVLFYVAIIVFTDLLLEIPENPKNIWDVGFGIMGVLAFPFFGVMFIFLFAMAIKSYRTTADQPRRRFIVLLAIGTICWLISGYVGALAFPSSPEAFNSATYIGTAFMATFFFVALINYQYDKVFELNQNLERKVVDRTRELKEKNGQLEDTLSQLKQMQKQVIVQEKLASLGQLVAGLTHEFNTPLGAIRSMKDTKSRALKKLKKVLENPPENGNWQPLVGIIEDADNLMDNGTERIYEVVQNLKSFARLDEAESAVADIHQGLDSVVGLVQHDLLKGIDIVRDYGEVPPFLCHPRKLNQVFFNLIKNAAQAID
nr:hypothetical protein [Calditrichia bacterium]